jgi:alginate O-acetyltransferase complex protein AlgJ
MFLFCIAVVFLAPGAALLAKATGSSDLNFLSTGYLFGQVAQAKMPEISVGDLLEGKTQQMAGLWLPENMGKPRELLIRAGNTIDFAIGRSSVPSIVIGREGELYTAEQISDRCVPNQNKAGDAYIEDIASGLQRTAKRLHAIGMPLVVWITPSKAAVMPQYLPGFCKEVPNDSRLSRRLIASLQEKGVTVVDSESLIEQSGSPYRPFPHFGQHWDDVGQFYAVRDLVSSIERLSGKTIGHLELASVELTPAHQYDEMDSGGLLNVMGTLKAIVPRPTFSVSERGSPINMLIVGSSFTWGPMRILLGQGLASRIIAYPYLREVRLLDKTNGALGGPLDTTVQQDIQTRLGKVDAVIIEANAPAVVSGHVRAFIDAIEAVTR